MHLLQLNAAESQVAQGNRSEQLQSNFTISPVFQNLICIAFHHILRLWVGMTDGSVAQWVTH